MEKNYDLVVCKPDVRNAATDKFEELENKIECLEAKNDFLSEFHGGAT